jgi:Phosphoheptose isomerase
MQNHPHIPKLADRNPSLDHLEAALLQATDMIVSSLTDAGGKILAAGNGGSCSDALHFSGELLKSFVLARPIDSDIRKALSQYSFGEELCDSLETGIPVVVLGQNPSLSSAYLNDRGKPESVVAQECLALIKPGDILVTFSTSGNAENLVRAMAVAKARKAQTIAFTGKSGGKMGEIADLEVRSPAGVTATVQEDHIVLYHKLCMLIEARIFGA